MSIVALENPVSRTAWRPKPISMTLSAGGFEAMNDRAAETAFWIAAPVHRTGAVDQERDALGASEVLRREADDRLTVLEHRGAVEDGVGVTTE